MLVMAGSIVAAAAVGDSQIKAQANDIEALTEDVEENANDIEVIQQTLIQRQGEVALQVQRIESEQKAQGKDLDQILNLLQQIQRAGN